MSSQEQEDYSGQSYLGVLEEESFPGQSYLGVLEEDSWLFSGCPRGGILVILEESWVILREVPGPALPYSS